MRATSILALALILSFPLQTSADRFSVAVTIKPVHSLVAALMKGTGEPRLIMRSNASPHHYSLRPSERRALDASLVIWVGPELEGFMPRILHNLDPTSTNIALIDTEGLLRLPARTAHHHTEEHSHIDPHIWLSADNAHAMVDVIATELVRLDKAHADIYETNRRRLHKRINDTDELIRRRLSGRTSAFISYHDAYQYFEKAYGLNNAGFVSSGDEISPSAKYVHELRNQIYKQQLRCLFYDAPARPALVDTLTHGLAIEALELDALGIRLEPGEDTWFDIMTGLADAYKICL